MKIKSKNIILNTITSLIFVFFLLMAFYFSLAKNIDIIKNMSMRFDNLLLQTFMDNERIADAITVRYFENNNKIDKVKINRNYDHVKDIYGFNLRKDHMTASYMGTLQSDTPISDSIIILIKSTDEVMSEVNQIAGYSEKNNRYLLSVERGFIYTLAKISLKDYSIDNLAMLTHAGRYFTSPPDYYKRKIEKELRYKGMTSTNIYHDVLSNEDAYSITSFVYSLTNNNMPIAMLMYDHNQSELKNLLTPFIDKRLENDFSMQLTDSKGKSICIYGDCKHLFKQYIVKLSENHTIISGIYFGTVVKSVYFIIPMLIVVFFMGMAYTYIRKYINSNVRDIITDPLTGVYNRRILDHLNLVEDRVVIAVFDCNKFKIINDNYGHSVGDYVLKKIASIMKSSVRVNNDYIIRTGGDEFLIIFNTNDISVAEKVVTRISHEVENTEFIFDSERLDVSLSYGITTLKGNIEQSLQQADIYMYHMKRNTNRDN